MTWNPSPLKAVIAVDRGHVTFIRQKNMEHDMETGCMYARDCRLSVVSLETALPSNG